MMRNLIIDDVLRDSSMYNTWGGSNGSKVT
jgi:hypothetical protein